MPMLRILISDADPSPEAVPIPFRATRAVTLITTGLAALLRALEEADERVRGYESPETAITPREWEVLHLLAERRTNAEIASQLCISEHTARGHTRRILRKLGVRSRQEAGEWARRVNPKADRTT